MLYASDDLRAWTLLSEFADPAVPGGPWECPDLFPLAVEGPARCGGCCWSACCRRPGGGSGMRWWVGDFDGTVFTPEHGGWLDHGRDCYAAVTYNDAPDGRRVMIGWLGNWAYARRRPPCGWRGAMTLPRDLPWWPPTPGRACARRVAPRAGGVRAPRRRAAARRGTGAARRRAADLVRRRGRRAGRRAGAGRRSATAFGSVSRVPVPARGRRGRAGGVAGPVLGRGVRRRRERGADYLVFPH